MRTTRFVTAGLASALLVTAGAPAMAGSGNTGNNAAPRLPNVEVAPGYFLAPLVLSDASVDHERLCWRH